MPQILVYSVNAWTQCTMWRKQILVKQTILSIFHEHKLELKERLCMYKSELHVKQTI